MSATTETPPTLEAIEGLLAPISEEDPSGKSLRYEGTYDLVEKLRREDDPTLPQGVWKQELKRAEWPEVARVCGEALESRSKDLRIAGWLLEAWFHLYSLPGLEIGARLIAGLCTRFWNDVHPRIEDDDVDRRLAPLHWVNDHMALTVKRLHISRPEAQDTTPRSWADWERALFKANQAATAKAKKDTKDEDTREKVELSITLTPIDFYQELEGQLETAAAAVGELARAVTELDGPEAPSFRELQDVMTEVRAFNAKVLSDRSAEQEEPDSEEAGDAPAEAGGETAPQAGIRSRAEAYRMLTMASEYLIRTEPHSPVPYLVKRAVTWGSMPLADLFKELLRGGADIKTIYTLLGIQEGPD